MYNYVMRLFFFGKASFLIFYSEAAFKAGPIT